MVEINTWCYRKTETISLLHHAKPRVFFLLCLLVYRQVRHEGSRLQAPQWHSNGRQQAVVYGQPCRRAQRPTGVDKQECRELKVSLPPSDDRISFQLISRERWHPRKKYF